MSLNKAQLVSAVAANTGMTKVDTEKAINGTMAAIASELAGGGGVTLIGFGTFSVVDKKARQGKNPRTGASIKIPAKKVPKFKAGKALVEKVHPPKKGKK